LIGKAIFFKLSNGKFITPDRLEQMYKGCKLVSNLWIFADQKWDNIVAVVNVNEVEFMAQMKSIGILGEKNHLKFKDMIKNEVAVNQVLYGMQMHIESLPFVAPFEI